MPGMDNPIDENKIVSKFLVDSNQAVKFKLVRNEEEIQNDKVRVFFQDLFGFVMISN